MHRVPVDTEERSTINYVQRFLSYGRVHNTPGGPHTLHPDLGYYVTPFRLNQSIRWWRAQTITVLQVC